MNTPYEWDLPIFRKLGLTPFEAADLEKHFVGEVVMDDSRVKIWVTCYPAQFWTFEITSGESGDITTLLTGSGSLTAFWPHASAIASGMLAVESVKVAEGGTTGV